jgi:hypothetical protein
LTCQRRGNGSPQFAAIISRRPLHLLGLCWPYPKYGPVKVDKLLSRCRIAPTKTVGGLSARQRDELAALLAGPTPGRDGPIQARDRPKRRWQPR